MFHFISLKYGLLLSLQGTIRQIVFVTTLRLSTWRQQSQHCQTVQGKSATLQVGGQEGMGDKWAMASHWDRTRNLGISRIQPILVSEQVRRQEHPLRRDWGAVWWRHFRAMERLQVSLVDNVRLETNSFSLSWWLRGQHQRGILCRTSWTTVHN